MSYYILNINEDIDFNNIIIGKEVKISDNISKIYLYWHDTKPKDIYIKTPSLRIIHNFKHLKFNQIKMPIYPLWDLNENLLTFFKKLEKYLQQKIKINKPYTSILEKTDKITTLKINVSSNNKIKIDNYKINSELECVISLPWIWIKEDSWGLSLYGYQFKYIPQIEDEQINFYPDNLNNLNKSISENNLNKNTIENHNNLNKSILDNLNKSTLDNLNKSTNNKVKLELSPGLLSDTLKKMKENSKKNY